MFCSQCGSHVEEGFRFCQQCGAPLQTSERVAQQPASPGASGSAKALRRSSKPQDPYQPQITQLKLQLRQLKLDLKQITTRMSSTRSRYNESSAFVPGGLLHKGYKMFEDMTLLGPQQQKQQLQQQIMQLEQELLSLQEQQAQWKAQ